MQEATNIDKETSAEVPSDTIPHLGELVPKHMIHCPCSENPTARCLREGRGSKKFPKPFGLETVSNEGDNYLSYRKKFPRKEAKLISGLEKIRVSVQ